MKNCSDIHNMTRWLKVELEEIFLDDQRDKNYAACVSYHLFKQKVDNYIKKYGHSLFKERYNY